MNSIKIIDLTIQLNQLKRDQDQNREQFSGLNRIGQRIFEKRLIISLELDRLKETKRHQAFFERNKK